MPGLLLLVARHLARYDPPRVLAWRLLHLPALADAWGGFGPLLPRPSGSLDRDPIALALAAFACGLAAAYLAAATFGARPRLRAILLGLASLVLVVLPSLAFIAMGVATGRPHGQDGGVVQLPLAIERILSGRSPYGADYSDSMLGRQARVSDFWSEHGGNPILHHHAYLPGTHLLMLPFVPLSRAVLGTFDPRVATLVAYVLAALLAALLARDPERRLVAAAAVLISPLVYWQQIFGANDVMVAALLLAAVHLAVRERSLAAAALLGVACAVKQLAWPFAPFLLAHLSGARGLRELFSMAGLRRLAGPFAVCAAVFVAIVLPVAALDFRAFWGDVVVYNVGLPGADNYPLGGTPGFGFANFLIYFGAVSSLRDYVPFGAFYLLLVPLGLCLLVRQLREGTATAALLTGSAALLLSLYFSRVVHPNYLILAAILVPAALCANARWATAGAVTGLLLLAVAVEVAEGEGLRATWEDGPEALRQVMGALAPRAGPDLTHDPMGLLLSATAAGLGITCLVSAVLAASERIRLALVISSIALVVIAPTLVLILAGARSGGPRLQDAWGAAALEASRAGEPPTSTRAVHEAWSSSFRKDPPGIVVTTSVGPGTRVLGRVLGRLRVGDPRWLTLLAVTAVAILLARRGGGQASLFLAVTLLSPAAALGVLFGAGDLVLLAVLLLCVPAGAFALLAAMALWLGLFRGTGAIGPGIGATSLALYAGLAPGTPAGVLGLVPALVPAAAALGRRLFASSWLGLAATALLVAQWLSPAASPDDVVTPIVLGLFAWRASAALPDTNSAP